MNVVEIDSKRYVLILEKEFFKNASRPSNLENERYKARKVIT